MSFWDGTVLGMKQWRWKTLRVWSPVRKCARSKRYLFLKNAYYGVFS